MSYVANVHFCNSVKGNAGVSPEWCSIQLSN